MNVVEQSIKAVRQNAGVPAAAGWAVQAVLEQHGVNPAYACRVRFETERAARHFGPEGLNEPDMLDLCVEQEVMKLMTEGWE